MKFVPRLYQSMAIDFLLKHQRCALYAGMGLGKTVSTLMAVRHLQEWWGEGPALVLAPLRVAQSTWPDEVAKWDDLQGTRVSVICGSAVQRRAALDKDADIYTMNYENLEWLTSELERRGKEWPFAIVVADEATRLKGLRARQGSKRARVLAKALPKIRRFIELTGTPAPNGLEDLWGQIYFLDQGARLGKSMTAYHERFFRQVRVGSSPLAVRYEPLPGADRLIHYKISDIVLKINAEEWFDVKQPIFSTVAVDLPDTARRLYTKLEREFLAELESGKEIEAMNAAVKSGKCLQLASGAVYTDGESFEEVHKAKLEALRSIVEEAGGMPILVSYQFKHEAVRIQRSFPKAKLLDKNPKTLRDWNAGKIPLLLAHPASCGHGLSMQDGGNILVFFSAGWNLEHHDQIIERIGPTRQKQAGHERPVYVYYIVAKDTMDEVVLERLKTKRDVMDVLLEKKKKEAQP